MLWKVCFVAVFAVSSSAAASSLSQVCFVAVFAVSSSAAASSLSKVRFVAVFGTAVSPSAAASSLSNVCFVAVFAVSLSVAASSSSTASAASLALGKNRATTLAGWRTISLSKSTSFCCKTMFVCFCIFCLIGCTFDNRKMCSLQNGCRKIGCRKKKCAPIVGCTFDNRKMCSLQKTNTCRS